MTETAVMPADPVPVAAEAEPYSGFWRRVAAVVIDNLILLVPVVVLSYFVHPLLALALILGYGAYLESSEKRATFGKIACGIYVTDVQGQRIGFGRALARQALKMLSNGLGLITWLIFFLPVAFTLRRQGLHDLAVATVVRRDPARGLSDIAVAAVGGLIPLMFFAGMIAGIAVPAYQDYMTRGRMQQAVSELDPYKAAVEKYYVANGSLPRSVQELGMGMPASPLIKSFSLRDGRIVAEPANLSPTGVLLLTPSVAAGTISWKCTTDGIRAQAVPFNCR
jgi:uncharacterized RDD family membrane protein YckC/Tfp pilus assembly protein PilE